MEQTPPTASTPQPTEHSPPPQPPPPTSSTSSSLSSISASLPSTSSAIPSLPNPNPSQKPTTSQLPQPQTQQPQQQQQQQSTIQNSQTRPPFNRPWQQPSHFSHFSSHLPSVPPSHPSSSSPSPPPVPPFSASASSSISTPPAQRGGMAIGVPAHHPSPSAPPTSFSSLNPPSFGQQFGGLARNPVNVPESVAGSSSSQVRQPIQGMQGVGTVGSFGSSSQMRPGGIASHHQQRPVQSTLRPQTSSNNQTPASQTFQGHGLLRVPSVGSPGSPSPGTSQSLQSHNQPWLSSGSQGKPPLPSPSFRPQMNSQSLPQRSHIPQQHHHPISTTSQQQMPSAQQMQQSLPSQPAQEHYGQQFPSSRVPQSLSHQQQISRGPLLGNQKASPHGMVQPSTVQLTPLDKTASADTSESTNRIVSKRSIHELVSQIDPSERLDPEVEDILVDIADDFVESITTFGCSLAKHRKSSTLEAKDLLLHLERNWNMSLPGFRGDEIKGYRKQLATDIHRERLAVIKKSMSTADTAGIKSLGGQAAGNAKGHLAKAPMNVIGSPNPKIGEAA